MRRGPEEVTAAQRRLATIHQQVVIEHRTVGMTTRRGRLFAPPGDYLSDSLKRSDTFRCLDG